MEMHTIRVTVNGAPYERQVESRLLLVHFLRDQLRLTGRRIQKLNCRQTTWRKTLNLARNFYRVPLQQRNPRAMTHGKKTLGIGSIEMNGWSYWRVRDSNYCRIPASPNR